MQLHNLILPLALLTACASTPTVKARGCGNLDPCQTQNGMAVLAEPEIAQPILLSAQKGREAFQRYFGVEAAPIAIVPGGEITSDMQRDLKFAGYDSSLPWVSAADRAKLMRSSIRRQVMKQTKGMSAEQQEAIMSMALAKSDISPPSVGDMSATEKGALTHELGHMWFIAAFNPADGAASGGHSYGGWAPDWLDETAAVLLENETLTQGRRKAFKVMNLEDFYPLDTFLTMEHPALKSAQALKEKFGDKDGEGDNRAIFLTGEDAEEFLRTSGNSDPANFYTQARGFADFVIKTTGDEQVFAKLAQHLSEGDSFESWLAKTDGMPRDLPGLKADWTAHLAAR